MTDHVKERIREDEERKERQRQLEEGSERGRVITTADMAESLNRRQTKETDVETESTSLLPPDKAEDFRTRWNTVQASFVDEPRHAVEQADSLVAEVMQNLAQTFADERQNLESQWGRGNDVSTEDLRIALQRYRAFFSRLLSV